MKKHLLRTKLVACMLAIGATGVWAQTWQFANNADLWGAVTLNGGAQYDANATAVTTGGVTFTGTEGFVATAKGLGFKATGSTEDENISLVVPAGYKAIVSVYTSGNRTVEGSFGETTEAFNANWASSTKEFNNAKGTTGVTLYLYCNLNPGGADQKKAPFLEKIELKDMSSVVSYPWTANAVATIDGTKTTIKTYSSEANVDEGSEYTVIVEKVIKYGDNYYVLNDSQFAENVYGKTFTMGNAAAEHEINYEPIENVAFYGEVEDIFTEGENANKQENISVLSNGGGYTAMSSNPGHVTIAFNVPEKAVYKLALGMNNTNSRERGFNYAIDDNDVSETITVGSGQAYVQEIAGQTLEAGDHTMTLNMTYSLTPIFDYLLITKTGKAVPDCYVVGNMTDWVVNENYKMVPNEEAEGEEFMFTMDLTTESQFKVVIVEGKSQIWYPDGMGNNYGENGEITADGEYTIYFRPNGDGGDDWFYHVIYVASNSTEEDYTGYIVNADLTGTDGWNTEGTKGYHSVGGVVTCGNNAQFDFCQTIKDLPAGQYRLTAQAAYRYTGTEADEYAAIAEGKETKFATLYATAGTKTVSSLVQNRWEGASESNLYDGDGGISVVNNLYVPNSTAAMKAWFQAGKYVNEVVFNLAEAGDVTIGIVKPALPEPNPGDYTVIGPWKLVRLGDAEEEPVEHVYTLVGGYSDEGDLDDPILFGKTWDPTIEANDMKDEDGDGVYTIDFTSVELAPGTTVYYKVVSDHSWTTTNWGFDPTIDNPNGNANYVVTLPEGKTLPEGVEKGVFDVTFYFSPNAPLDNGYNVHCVMTYDETTTTGINSIAANAQGARVYNLNGQRVVKATKGLYIVNGRKQVVK